MDNNLAHVGIKGMKWGVRRYQNKDGTLTPAGRKKKLENTKRLVDASAKATNQVQTYNKENLRSKPNKKIKMDLKDISDQELRDKINRANLENQYTNLFGKDSRKVSKGREYATKVLDVVGPTLTMTGSALAIALAIKELKG